MSPVSLSGPVHPPVENGETHQGGNLCIDLEGIGDRLLVVVQRHRAPRMAVFDAGMPGGNQSPVDLLLRSTSPVFYGGGRSPTLASIKMDPIPGDDGFQNAASFEEEGVAFYKQQNYNIIGPKSPGKPNGKPRPASPSPPLLIKRRSVSDALDDLTGFFADPPTLAVRRGSDSSTPQVPRMDAGISHGMCTVTPHFARVPSIDCIFIFIIISMKSHVASSASPSSFPLPLRRHSPLPLETQHGCSKHDNVLTVKTPSL